MRAPAAAFAGARQRASTWRQVPIFLSFALCLITQLAIAAPADDRKQAAAAVEAAVRAFEAGDYARALAQFERAMALRPSPKIHYNLGVCHHQLMLEARARGDASAEARHAAAAVDAFRAYLREIPDAPDRLDVEEAIRDLGGTPVRHDLKPIPPPRSEPSAPPRAPDDGDPADPASDPPPPDGPANYPPPPVPEPGPTRVPAPAPAPPRPEPPAPEVRFRGRVGAGVGFLAQPQLDARRLDGAVQGVVTARLGGFVGARRRVYLGGAALLAGAPQTATDKLALHMQVLLLDLEYAHPVGAARRVEVVVGGFVAGAREALRLYPGQEPPTCAAATTGTLVSRRGGGGAGGRLGLHVLLGARKNHEIGVRLHPAILGFGKGTTAAGCEPRPFADLAVPQVRWIFLVDTGYAFRF